MNKLELTSNQRKKFYEECSSFDEQMSFADYKDKIKKYLFLVNRYDEQNDNYTIENAEEIVKAKAAEIETLFNAREPIGFAVSDIEFFCG